MIFNRSYFRPLKQWDLVPENPVNIYVAISALPRIFLKRPINSLGISWRQVRVEAIYEGVGIEIGAGQSIQVFKTPSPPHKNRIQLPSIHRPLCYEQLLFIESIA